MSFECVGRNKVFKADFAKETLMLFSCCYVFFGVSGYCEID